MIYPECDRNTVPVSAHHLHQQQSAGVDTSHHHQHLNLLHNHLNSADYAAAISALSPKYNTAFNVTNLLNPVLEDSYRKQQLQQQLDVNFQSYPNRTNMNSSGSSSTPSSTTSSSSSSSSSISVKQESPLSLGVHANMCGYAPAGSPESFSPNVVQPSPTSSAATAPLQNPYFNYAASNQFSNSLVGPPVSHYAAANSYSHYYNTSPYCSNPAAAAAESDSYSQLQYANNSAWYSNPNDPRFTSKYSCDLIKNFIFIINLF